MNNIIKNIIKNYKKWFLLVVLFEVLVVLNLHVPKIDGSFSSIGIETTGYIQKLKRIDSIFNHEKLVFVEIIPKSVTLSEVFNDCNKIEIDITNKLKNTSVKSIHTAEKILFSGKEKKEENIFDVLKDLSGTSLFQEIIANDSSSFLLLVNVEKEKKDTDFTTIIDDVLEKDYNSIEKIRVVSPWHIERGISNSIKHDLVSITLWILLAFSFIILYFYRSFRAIIFIILNMIFSIIPTLLLLGIYGYDLNMIIVLILPIVSILALADSIHILTGFVTSKEDSFKSKMISVYQKYIVPSFFTSLTTAIAFYSLLFNETKSISVLGIITGHIVLLSFVLCYLSSPFLLKLLKIEGRISIKVFNLGKWLERNKKPFSFALILLFIIALFLFNSLSYKNNFEIFLPKNAKVTEDHDSIKHHFYSQSTIDILLEFEDGIENKNAIIGELAGEFKNMEHIRVVKSSYKVNLPGFLSHFNFVDHARYSKNNGQTQLINLKVDNPNSIKESEKQILKKLEEKSGFKYTVSSPSLAFDEVNDSVAKSLMNSIVVSVLLLFAIFIFLTKSLKKGLVGIFVNIIPLSSIVVVFIVFDLNINMLTAITGVVSIGLIVDDTIHAFYRREVLNRISLNELGYGMITTTTILFVSFISFGISDFTPTVTFGLISSIVFVVALISDLTLLPYLLNLVRENNGKK